MDKNANFYWLFSLEFIMRKCNYKLWFIWYLLNMKKIFSKLKICLVLTGIVSLFILFWMNYTSAYQEILIENRGWHAIRVIKVILDWEHFVVSSVAGNWWETIQSLTKKVGGISSINWAFFCPKDYSNCSDTVSYYERIFKWDGASYSQFWPDTSIRWIFGFTQDGNPLFVQNKISDWDVGLISNINSERIDDLYFWISNFPVLLINWEDVTAWASEYIDSKMTWRWNRNFICSTEDWKTIYMWYIWTMNVWNMASYLKENFGCYNALFLDAGASSAMVYSGKILSQWSRTLITDAFVVVDRDAYLKLEWTPSKNYTPYIPDYEMTEVDREKVEKLSKIINAIYSRYWKDKNKTELISLFRTLVSNKWLSDSDKAVYNKVLIYLFTIWEL